VAVVGGSEARGATGGLAAVDRKRPRRPGPAGVCAACQPHHTPPSGIAALPCGNRID
jgi:hypothetical protein